MPNLVAYYRVSTNKQGARGLGMDAQRELVARYTAAIKGTVIQDFQEVETGKGNGLDRPQLAAALDYARSHRATLVIAKLDRLARNVHFVSGLMESGVPFIAADSPGDDRFITQVKAAMGEDEARKISQRTKEALAALKARGVRLGTPANLTQDARIKGASRNREIATGAYGLVAPLADQWRKEGHTLATIADRLNSYGHRTRRGCPWNQVQVMRVLQRMT